MRILIVEDDPTIASNLYDYLESRGHVVDAAHDGISGLHRAISDRFDAIILDLGLPGMDGTVLCRKLREEANIDTPILVLTARDTLEDKIAGFGHGADDYLVKPFSLKEVEVRLTALHKRSSGRVAGRVLEVGSLVYDPRTLTVRFEGANVKIPRKCLRLLELLMSNPGRVLTRQELEVEIWGDERETSDALRSHMHVMRRALRRAGGRDPIETVHGLGYRLVDTKP